MLYLSVVLTSLVLIRQYGGFNFSLCRYCFSNLLFFNTGIVPLGWRGRFANIEATGAFLCLQMG